MVSFLPMNSYQWRSISLWAFPLWGILPLLEFGQALKTSFWPAGVCFFLGCPVDNPRPFRWTYELLLCFMCGEGLGECSCYPTCLGSFCQAPFLSWPVRSCSLLPTVNQAESCQIMQCYTQPQEPGWDLQVHLHMQLKPRYFSQVCSVIEKKWGAKGQTSGIGA